MSQPKGRRSKSGAGRSPVSAATSLESMAAVLSATDRSTVGFPPTNTLSALASLLARSSDTDSGIIAALALLKRVTGAQGAWIDIGRDGTRRTMWSDGAPAVHPTDRIQSEHLFPLLSAGEAIGVLVLDTPTMSPAESSEIGYQAADIFAATVARDLRLRQLEEELRVQVRELAEQRRFMERIVDSLPFGLHVVDRDYRIQAWNHQRETGMMGLSRNDAIGRTIFEVFSRQPRELVKKEFDDVFATGTLQQFQTESNATGEPRIFRISKIPMSVGSDAVTHVITVGEDITDWQAAIDRIAHSEKLAALGQLAAGVMHELNNPLTTIAACAESITLSSELGAAGGMDMDPGRWVGIIDMEVKRCRSIIDGLLDFSRSKPAVADPVDCNDFVLRALFLLKHHPLYKRVIVTTEISDEPLIVLGDADQLIQAVIALAMNAFDVTPSGKHVCIRTRMDETGDGGRSAVIEVADEGPGVPRAMASRIFEPFFTTKPQGQGTGLGLSICYGIVAHNGGSFELVEPDVPGAVFRITLPLLTQPEASGL